MVVWSTLWAWSVGATINLCWILPWDQMALDKFGLHGQRRTKETQSGFLTKAKTYRNRQKSLQQTSGKITGREK